MAGAGAGARALVAIDVRAWAAGPGARSAATHVSAPAEVACFSRGADRAVRFGSRAQLARFRDPRLGSRLDAGLRQYVPKDEAAGDGVEPVVACLLAAGFDVGGEADIVTYRNNLNKIGGCPYNQRDAFEFDAVRVGRTCFLDIRKLPQPPPADHHRRFMYMGYKFEALCSSGVADAVPVNANAEFCIAVRLRVASHRIVLMAEIDAELQASSGSPHVEDRAAYVELKTTKRPESARDLHTLHQIKYQKWFLQSYLAGVRTICVGLRDDAGVLVDVDHVSTRSLWRAASDSAGGSPKWEPFVCINFIEYVSEQIRRVCAEHPGETIRFAYDPKHGVLSGRLLEGDTSFAARMQAILPT